MGDFDLETRVEGSNGRYRAEIHPDWEIWGPNGGYLAAMALRAAGAEAAIPRPATFSCHFLRVARFEPVDLEVTALHRGRRAESFRVSMGQAGKPVLEAMVRTAAAGPGLEHEAGAAPEVPDPETLQPREVIAPDDPHRHAFWKNLEQRHPDQDFRREPRRKSDPIWREWLRFRPRAVLDDVFADAGRLLLLVDTLTWPAAVQAHPDTKYVAPSLDVTAWFHRDARDSEWLLVDHVSPVGADALLGTHGRVWNRTGQLLASGGSQLLCTRAG